MTTAEEIRAGLDFLIKEAKELNALVKGSVSVFVDIDTYPNIFYAGLNGVPYEAAIKVSVLAKMEELGWHQSKDDDLLTFSHSI